MIENYYLNFRNNLDKVIFNYQDKIAITYMRNNGLDEKITFSDIGCFVQSTLIWFKKAGLVQGDRVAIISPHSPWAVFMGIAIAYAGMTIVLIDASLPQKEIEKLLEFSNVRSVFTTNVIYNRFDKNVINDITCFNLDDGLIITPFSDNNINCLKQNFTTDPEKDVIAILFSSGTTGQMKGIKVTYESVLKAKEIFVRLSGLQDYMSYLLVLPFNHIAGFTGAMTFFLTGCEIGFIEDVNATKLQNGLIKFQPHYFAMVPKVYEVMQQRILASIREKGKATVILMNTLFKISKFFRKQFGINIGRKLFHSITKEVFGENIFGIGTGASPCKDKTTEFFLNLGLEWANLYATTETCVPIVATGIQDKYPVGTVGNVHRNPEIQVKINNADHDGIGEILVKSELMMKGYFRRPDLTEEAFRNGFFKTGDYGYIDKKGDLHITGRMKESIVLQNGKKVSPSDVDDYYLMRIPDYDIASKGIQKENEQYDEIHLFIENRDYFQLDKKTIMSSFEEISRNAPDMYKLSGIHFINKIPRTTVGKVKRFSLKDDTEIFDDKEVVCKPSENDKDKFIELICKHCKLNCISMNSRIVEDLGLDSLTMYEIVCEIENHFHVDISYKLESVVTVEDIYNLIANAEMNENISYPKPKNQRMIFNLKLWIAFSKIIYKIKAEGIENIPSNDDYIICSNHESYFDPIWILAAMNNKVNLNKICCMAAIHTLEGKISGSLFEALGGIPVDRSGNTIPAINSAKKCLSQGKTLIVFPEGARSRDGSMLSFKSGAAKIAIDTNKKILPVRIDGAFEIFPRWIKYPRVFDWKHFCKYPLQIRFGKPIVPDGKTAEKITEEIKQQIVDMKN